MELMVLQCKCRDYSKASAVDGVCGLTRPTRRGLDDVCVVEAFAGLQINASVEQVVEIMAQGTEVGWMKLKELRTSEG